MWLINILRSAMVDFYHNTYIHIIAVIVIVFVVVVFSIRLSPEIKQLDCLLDYPSLDRRERRSLILDHFDLSIIFQTH